jgi:tripartite-type tricarboxylate transporter receptor subunit TctC
MPAKGLKELVAWLKADPNKASAGIAVMSFRPETTFFQKETGTQFILIPYRGSAPAVQDLMADRLVIQHTRRATNWRGLGA